MDLRGQTALVTGGARRVGRAISLELAGAGANIVIHCRLSLAEAHETADAVRAAGAAAVIVNGDLGRSADVNRIAEHAEAAFGRVDVLVNNASTFLQTPIETLTADTWQQVLDVNLKGPSLLACRLGRAMQAGAGGVIINIADWAALRPYRGYLPYCVSKAGIVALTGGLAKALAPSVRVNCVAPGPVLPPDDYSAVEREQSVQLTPLKRLGTAADVARLVRFLVEADFCTGGVYLVDGGRLNA